MADVFERALELQHQIAELKEQLKFLEGEYYTAIREIRTENLTSVSYGIRMKRKPAMKVKADWWKQNYPEFYQQTAHLSHPASVGLMTKICGGYSEFQRWMRNAKPEEFDAVATVTMEDVRGFIKETGLDMDDLKSAGALIEDEVKNENFEVFPRGNAEKERMIAEAL